jgi:hypothetical protein
MVRVAVTGLGFMGKTHLGIYNGLDGVEIAALCDKGEERVNLTSLDAGGNIEASSGAVDFSGVAKYTDYDAMLKAGGFDAVDICLPTDLHAEFAVKAPRRGIPRLRGEAPRSRSPIGVEDCGGRGADGKGVRRRAVSAILARLHRGEEAY